MKLKNNNYRIQLLLGGIFCLVLLSSGCQKTGKAFSWDAGVDQNIYNLAVLASSGKAGTFDVVVDDNTNIQAISPLVSALGISDTFRSEEVSNQKDLIIVGSSSTNSLIKTKYPDVSVSEGEAVVILDTTDGTKLYIISSSSKGTSAVVNALLNYKEHKELKSTKVKVLADVTVKDLTGKVADTKETDTNENTANGNTANTNTETTTGTSTGTTNTEADSKSTQTEAKCESSYNDCSFTSCNVVDGNSARIKECKDSNKCSAETRVSSEACTYECSSKDWQCDSYKLQSETSYLKNEQVKINSEGIPQCIYKESYKRICNINKEVTAICGDSLSSKPVEKYDCVPNCEEKWTEKSIGKCESHGDFIFQNVEWIDQNNCGTEYEKPKPARECTLDPSKGTLIINTQEGANITVNMKALTLSQTKTSRGQSDVNINVASSTDSSSTDSGADSSIAAQTNAPGNTENSNSEINIAATKSDDVENSKIHTVIDLIPGDYEITAVMEGYSIKTYNTTIESGKITKIDIKLNPYVKTEFARIKDKKLFDNFRIVIGASADLKDNLGALDVADGHRISKTVLDSNINLDDLSSQNLIIVGGPCANKIAAKLSGKEWKDNKPADDCAEGYTTGKGTVWLIKGENSVKILVMGASADDTRRLSYLLKKFTDYETNLKATKIEACGDDITDVKFDCSNFKPNEERNNCAKSRGSWKIFANSCVDSCEFAKTPSMTCEETKVNSCDCGILRCWDGKSCVNNPVLEKLKKTEITATSNT